MKIYEDLEEYWKGLVFWSNACGDLFNPNEIVGGESRPITDAELPEEFKSFNYEDYYLVDGMYSYLAQYNGKYGIALVNEYHEYSSEGTEKDPNNYERAVKLAKDIESKFPQHSVLIGKQMGFPNDLPDGTKDDATELVVFVDTDWLRDEKNEDAYFELVDYLDKNAYIPYEPANEERDDR